MGEKITVQSNKMIFLLFFVFLLSEKIVVMGSNFDSVYGWIMFFFKNWNKIFKNYKNAIVLRDYRFFSYIV